MPTPIDDVPDSIHYVGPVLLLDKIELKRTHAGAFLPQRATDGSAGYDLKIPDGRIKYREVTAHGAVEKLSGSPNLVIPPGQTFIIEMGFAIHINNPFWEAQIRARSGIASKRHLVVPNSPGTIDSDYQGDVSVALHNHGAVAQELKCGEHIAQMVFAPVGHPQFNVVEEFTESTERGEGGFGSTGVS